MSQENVDVVLEQFAATNAREFPRAMRLYAEDVELVVDHDAFLRGGTFTGREAVDAWFADWFSTFERKLIARVELYRSPDEALATAAVE